VIDNAHAQEGFQIRVEWGHEGVERLSASCAVLVVVDVLSFSTAVDIVVGRGAEVVPLRWSDGRATAEAKAAGAVLANGRSDPGWSLSPASLTTIPPATLLALSSPNGATLCADAASSGVVVMTGCLRNAAAIADLAAKLADDNPIGIIPAGERWGVNRGPLRAAVEDWLGAGAVASALLDLRYGSASPEARLAALTYRSAVAEGLARLVRDCASGRELAAIGFRDDVELAVQLDVSSAVPMLIGGTLRAQ